MLFVVVTYSGVQHVLILKKVTFSAIITLIEKVDYQCVQYFDLKLPKMTYSVLSDRDKQPRCASKHRLYVLGCVCVCVCVCVCFTKVRNLNTLI